MDNSWLNQTAFFHLLPQTDQQQFIQAMDHVTYSKGSVPVEQGITQINHWLVLIKGKARFFFEDNQAPVAAGTLYPKDSFGALSILFNDHMAIRSLKMVEESRFATLPTDLFLSFCRSVPEFQEFFTAAFGRNMVNPIFSGRFIRQAKDRTASLAFFNQPIWSVFTPTLTACTPDTTIMDAVAKMNRNNTSAILIKKNTAGFEGIVTDADLRKKVIQNQLDLSAEISSIMSAPLAGISADCQVFEAFLSMVEHDKRHIAVHGQLGHVTGILRQKDLIAAQTNSTYLLIKTVKSATSVQKLANIHSKLEKMLLDPLKSGANPEYITRLIATFSDAIIDKIIGFSIQSLGPPPCRFAFLTMGSEGRAEQTLISDQDNAIVFEDVPDTATAKDYFDRLARQVCDQLDKAGYRFCSGGNMAKNDRWCQPISIWKKYFTTWVRTSSPENLLHSSIFFDFRGTWGDMGLADELKMFLLTSIGKWSGFLRNLTENTLYFKPPITRLGRFIVESSGEHKGSLDLKLAMMPLIDFTRVYALKHQIAQPNTLTRLFRLYIRHALTKEEHRDIVRAYNFMMRLRLLGQITAIMDEGRIPDNHINPKNLSSLDQLMLKEIFKITQKFQHKLSIEFTGVV